MLPRFAKDHPNVFLKLTSTMLAQVLNCKGKLLNNSVFHYCHRRRRRGGDQTGLCTALCLGFFCPYSQSVEVKFHSVKTRYLNCT